MPSPQTNDHVSADMERIFKPLVGRAPVLATAQASDVRKIRAPVSRGLTIAAPALVLVVSAAMAIGYARVDRTNPAPVKAAAVSSVPTTPVLPSSQSSSVARSSEARPVEPEVAPAPLVLAATGTAAPRRAAGIRDKTDYTAQRQTVDTVKPSSTPAPAPRRAEPSPLSRQLNASNAEAVRSRTNLDTERPSADQPCATGQDEDRCIYKDVLDADNGLRQAYAIAKQEGVSDSWLAAVARRWKRARENADYDPDGTIRRYGQLEDALDRKRRKVAR